MTYIPQQAVILYSNPSSSSITGTVSETTFNRDFTIKSGMMGVNDFLEVLILWSATNNGNVKTIRFKIGSTTVFAFPATSNASGLRFGLIFNRGSLASQVANTSAGTSGFGSTTSALNTFTENFANDLTIALTGELATGTDTISVDAYSVTLFKVNGI